MVTVPALTLRYAMHDMKIDHKWLDGGKGHWEMELTYRGLQFTIQIYGGRSVGMSWWALDFSRYPAGVQEPDGGGRHPTPTEALAHAEQEVIRVVSERSHG